MSKFTLPEGFATLEPFVAEWAIEGSAARAAKRGDSTPEAREAFFAAMMPLAGAALERLDATPLAALDPAERRLMNLLLCFAHVAQAVEILGPNEPRHACLRQTMRITRSPADLSPSA